MDHPQNIYSELFQGSKDWDWGAKLILKKKYGQLTLADLKLDSGGENELLERIGIRLLKTRQEVIKTLKLLKLTH